MKIKKLSETKTIISSEENPHNYFGWPSIEITKNGRMAVACSGYRVAHVCPFGKAIISFSDDGGETFTAPKAVIDTVLDDRDAGLCAFGKSGLILTSFNNTVEFQRGNCSREHLQECYDYLDTVKPEDEEKALGAEFCISLDNGNSWSEIYHSPITSPHGPTALSDGTILWVGNIFNGSCNNNNVQCYKINLDGTMQKISEIEADEYYCFCEPHIVECADGRLVCHLRSDTLFTLFQSESFDKGKSWTKPHRILEDKGGAPSHILRTSKDMLVASYGYREMPYGIKLMFSLDNGKTWDTDHKIYEDTNSGDLGYPATVGLPDGSFFTVFYAHEKEDSPAVIMAQKWIIEQTKKFEAVNQ